MKIWMVAGALTGAAMAAPGARALLLACAGLLAIAVMAATRIDRGRGLAAALVGGGGGIVVWLLIFGRGTGGLAVLLGSGILLAGAGAALWARSARSSD